jgi:hypothetical protein
VRDSAPGSRIVNFSRNGEKRFLALFGTTDAEHNTVVQFRHARS